MILMAVGWAAKIGKAAMDLKAILLQPPKVWANQVPKPGPFIILMFKENKWWDMVNYEDHIIELEDGTLKFGDEEIGPEPKMNDYVTCEITSANIS